MNVWLNHVPWGADELPSSVRRRLRALPAVHMGFASASPTLPVVLPPKDIARAAPLRWTFGDRKENTQLELVLPWPAEAIAARTGSATAPFVTMSLERTAVAELRPAPSTAARPRKKGAQPAAPGTGPAKKRSRDGVGGSRDDDGKADDNQNGTGRTREAGRARARR